jgi:hypothetical protein
LLGLAIADRISVLKAIGAFTQGAVHKLSRLGKGIGKKLDLDWERKTEIEDSCKTRQMTSAQF